MAIFMMYLFGVIIIGLIGLIYVILRKGVCGLKLMLLGISIILVGGIIGVDPNYNFGGYEYIIVFIGLILSIIGLGKKD